MRRVRGVAQVLAGILVVAGSWQARAADLGGNCCVDLEERIAELEPTTARKGNRKVTLTISGLMPSLTFGAGSYNLVLPSIGAVVIDSHGNPFVINGNRIAVLDRTTLANADRAGFALMSGVDNVLASVLDGPPDQTGSRLWALPFGDFASIDGNSSLVDADQSLAGALAGATFRLAPGLSFGVFGGAARAELETDLDDSVDTDYGLVGVYGRYRAAQFFFDASLTGAWSSSDGERVMATNIGPTPFETARSDYDGWIVSPAIGLGWLVPVSDGAVIVPALKVRGQFTQLDGYTETGSSANATIGSRDLDHVEGRLELGFRKDVSAATTVRAKAGLSLIERFGDDEVTAVLLGRAITFASGAEESEAAGYVGAGFDTALMPSLSMFGDTELMLGNESQAISGFVGLRAKF